MGNRILGARGCVRQGVLWGEILTILPWTLSRRRWERRANPGAEDQRKNRRKRRLHLEAFHCRLPLTTGEMYGVR